MSDDAKSRFRATLDSLIGAPVGSAAPMPGPDPVNMPMIRHWADALEDRNRVYTDPEFAAKSRFKGIVAPPVMLQTWMMGRPLISGIIERGGVSFESGLSPLKVLDDAGFVGTIATNSEFEIERYLHLGEHLSATTVIESISDEKKTALGPGHFVTWETTYLDEKNQVVGRQKFRMLKFKPEKQGGDPS